MKQKELFEQLKKNILENLQREMDDNEHDDYLVKCYNEISEANTILEISEVCSEMCWDVNSFVDELMKILLEGDWNDSIELSWDT